MRGPLVILRVLCPLDSSEAKEMTAANAGQVTAQTGDAVTAAGDGE